MDVAHNYLPVLFKRFYGSICGKEVPFGVGHRDVQPLYPPCKDTGRTFLYLKVHPAALEPEGPVVLKGDFYIANGLAGCRHNAKIGHHLEAVTDTQHEGVPFYEFLEFLHEVV